MLRLIKTGVVAALAAMTFIVTTLTGLVAGLIGAMLRAQLPDSAMTDSPSQEADATPPTSTPKADKSRTAPALHQQARH
jgi:hypothetical protein